MKALARAVALSAIGLACASVPAAAAPLPTIVNGDFETGTLAGWQQSNSGSGGWFAYHDPVAPLSGNALDSPPQGQFAATTDETMPGGHILYQDIAVPPGTTSSLTLIAYYRSYAAISVPNPDSLDPSVAAPNQQYRIELIKPSAPVNTVDPADILATIFRTRDGDSTAMEPTVFTTDLSPFAGQTVRLRFADVDNSFYMNSSVDAVGFKPSNQFTVGKPVRNLHRGTAQLPVQVPAAGTVTLSGNNVAPRTVSVPDTGTVDLAVAARNAPLSTLRRSGRVRVKLTITYAPTGGDANSATSTLILKRSGGR
jgi:hypothetical protein